MAVAKGPSWKGCVRSHPCLAMRGASKAGEQLCLPKQRAIAEPRPQTQILTIRKSQQKLP